RSLPWAQVRTASRNLSACSSASRKTAPRSPDAAPPSSDTKARTTRLPCRSAALALSCGSRVTGTSAGLLPRLLGGTQGSLELGLIVMRERGLKNLASGALELLQHLVRRRLSHQDEQHRAAGLHGRRQLLHELVIDAHIREGTGDRPGRGAHGQAEQRIQKDQ